MVPIPHHLGGTLSLLPISPGMGGQSPFPIVWGHSTQCVHWSQACGDMGTWRTQRTWGEQGSWGDMGCLGDLGTCGGYGDTGDTMDIGTREGYSEDVGDTRGTWRGHRRGRGR